MEGGGALQKFATFSKCKPIILKKKNRKIGYDKRWNGKKSDTWKFFLKWISNLCPCESGIKSNEPKNLMSEVKGTFVFTEFDFEDYLSVELQLASEEKVHNPDIGFDLRGLKSAILVE